MDDVTRLLNQWVEDGRPDSLDQVINRVFRELKRIARNRLASSSDLSLQPTELVHEAYMRLRKTSAVEFEDRSRFFALASRLIRTVLVDHARERQAQKRGRDYAVGSFEELGDPKIELDLDRTLALDGALKRLEATHPRQSRVVELRVFGGLTIPEIADTLVCSQPTVERDWSLGRRRLARELKGMN